MDLGAEHSLRRIHSLASIGVLGMRETRSWLLATAKQTVLAIAVHQPRVPHACSFCGAWLVYVATGHQKQQHKPLHTALPPSAVFAMR